MITPAEADSGSAPGAGASASASASASADRPLLHLFASAGDASDLEMSDSDGEGDAEHESRPSDSASAGASIPKPPSAQAKAQQDALIPSQGESIVDRRAIVRYFADGARTPELHDVTAASSSSPSASAPASSASASAGADGADGAAAPRAAAAAHYDVLLRLDVTTGCGGRVWPAAEVLGAYLSSRAGLLRDSWRGKTVLELGAGTGLVGLLAARLGLATEGVWITDQTPMMRLMLENCRLNDSSEHPQGPAPDKCHVAELNWGEPLPSDVPHKPDVLLLADCVYLETAFAPLVSTLVELSTPSTEILFCYQKRRKADKRFFALARKRFAIADVEDDDALRAQKYRREGTQLMRFTLKQ